MSLLRLLTLAAGLWLSTAGSATEPVAHAARGAEHFARGDFGAAIAAYAAATAAAPGVAEYHHQLGRSYGRAAERASWWRALELAEAARAALERAVELAPSNAAATLDLMKFYAAAPGFLGGDADKAQALVMRLDRLDPRAAAKARDWLAEHRQPAS